MAVGTVAAGDEVQSEDHNALAGLVNGTANYGNPVKLYQYSDSSTYSLTVGNQDTTNGYALKVQYGTVASPTTLMTVAKALTQVTNPFQALGVSAGGKGGVGVDSSGVVQMGGETGSGHGSSSHTLMISRTSATNVSEGMITADFHNRMGTGADCTSLTLRGSEGNLSGYSSSSGPSDNFVVLEIRPVFATQSGLIANGHGNTRRGIGIGFQTQTAAANANGSLAHKEVGIYLDASAPGAFVESPVNGTGPNAAIFIGGSNPNASTTACAWEWGLVMAGTSTFDSTPIFGIYKTGRTGIAMVPQITSRGGMLQVNQDSNNDDGSGLRLFKNASTASYTSMHLDASGNTTVKSVLSGTGNSQFALACNATLTAFEVTSATSQSGNLLKLTIGGGSTMFAVSAAADLLIGAGHTAVGSGAGVIAIKNASTNPSTNPSGGGILYSTAGAGTWRGSSGTVTTFGPAEPHCPDCGRDFA